MRWISRSLVASVVVSVVAASGASAQSFFGESFMAPTTGGTFLQTISTEGFGIGAGVTVPFQLYLLNITEPTGTALFTQLVGGPTDAVDSQLFTIGLSLTPGAIYVFGATIGGGATASFIGGDAFTGGAELTCIAGTPPSNCQVHPTADLPRFAPTFGATTTPEPVSMLLLATGLLGVAGAGRRRNRRLA